MDTNLVRSVPCQSPLGSDAVAALFHPILFHAGGDRLAYGQSYAQVTTTPTLTFQQRQAGRRKFPAAHRRRHLLLVRNIEVEFSESALCGAEADVVVVTTIDAREYTASQLDPTCD